MREKDRSWWIYVSVYYMSDTATYVSSYILCRCVGILLHMCPHIEERSWWRAVYEDAVASYCMTLRHADSAGLHYDGAHIVVRGHIYSSMRTHIYQYEDRYIVVTL